MADLSRRRLFGVSASAAGLAAAAPALACLTIPAAAPVVRYDDSFARDGLKIGGELRIRLPLDYTVRAATGPGGRYVLPLRGA